MDYVSCSMKYSFLTRDSHAKNAGISEAILLDNSAADFEVTQSLQTYPTTGILLLIVNMLCMLAHPKF